MRVWELEITVLFILLVVINVGFVLAIVKFKISSIVLFIAPIANATIVVLLLTYFNVGSFIEVYAPYKYELKVFDVTFEYLELTAFLAIFFAAFIARAKYPVIGGKGWNILLLAIMLGSIGMVLDIYGEYFWLFDDPFLIYKLTTNIFQIAGIIGLAVAFLAFYKFSEILFTPSPKD